MAHPLNPLANSLPRLLDAWRRSYAFVLIATFAVVATADYLLYGHALGWTAALVAAAMLFSLALRDTSFLRHTGGRIAWVAAVGLIVALFEQPTWLNILYILICLSVLALVNAHGWDSDFVRWLRRVTRWFLTGWTRLFRDNGLVVRWLIRGGLSPTMARGIAVWIIPLIFTSIFVGIFAWANPIISGWFAQLGTVISNLVEKLPQLLNIARCAFWLAFAAFAWSLMRGRTARGRRRAMREQAMSDAEWDEWITSVRATREHNALGIPASMVIRCLLLFNVVFAVENALDSRFLWTEALPPGVTYTQYVHRGAYPLVAAALLAGAFVLVTFNPHSSTERSPWARRLVYLWIAQTIFLTLSAAWRLARYVDLTALTRLRLASMIWFLLVALGLVYIVRRIVSGRSNTWLVNINAVTALLVLYPCCFINFDGLIARYNVRHCAEAGGRGWPLSIDYLETLGTPALPALDAIREKLADANAPAEASGERRARWGSDNYPIVSRRAQADAVSAKLHAQLDAELSDWRTWTWRRERIKRDVEQLHLAHWRARTPTQQFAQAAAATADR